jgi:hypothetical protein
LIFFKAKKSLDAAKKANERPVLHVARGEEFAAGISLPGNLVEILIPGSRARSLVCDLART